MNHPVTLSIDVDTRLLRWQMACLQQLLPQLSPKRARKFLRKALRLVLAGDACQLVQPRFAAAPGAACLRCRLRVAGLDELIAAAMRAVRGNGFVVHGEEASDEC